MKLSILRPWKSFCWSQYGGQLFFILHTVLFHGGFREPLLHQALYYVQFGAMTLSWFQLELWCTEGSGRLMSNEWMVGHVPLSQKLEALGEEGVPSWSSQPSPSWTDGGSWGTNGSTFRGECPGGSLGIGEQANRKSWQFWGVRAALGNQKDCPLKDSC